MSARIPAETLAHVRETVARLFTTAAQLDALPPLVEELLRERDVLGARCDDLTRDLAAARAAHETVAREHESLVDSVRDLQARLEAAGAAAADLRTRHTELLEERRRTAEELDVIARRIRG